MAASGGGLDSRSSRSRQLRKRLTRRRANPGHQLAPEDLPDDGPEDATADVPEGANIADEVLGAQVAAFADAVMPRPSHRLVKKQLLARLEALAQEILDPLAKSYTFGSSVNGCGEASSDMDVTIYVPPNVDQELLLASEALSRMADGVAGRGFLLLETRFNAHVPIIVLEMLDAKEKRTGYTCDVCFQHLLPVHNTRLIRTYIDLAPQLAALTVVVKRWAKVVRIAGTWEHFISTYSWTLMALYYCQVELGLPSLHAMARKHKPGAPPPGERAHDAHFLGLQSARQRYCPGEVTEAGLGAMVRGFFEFYAESFDWDNEVVSVRLGERRHLEDANGHHSPLFSTQLRQAKLKRARRIKYVRGFPHLNIEDPIEVHRNLNFALRPGTYSRICAEVVHARDLLEAGAGLCDLLQLEGLPVAKRRRSSSSGRHPWLSGFLALGKRPPCECSQCGEQFKDFSTMLGHESECNPMARLLFRALQL